MITFHQSKKKRHGKRSSSIFFLFPLRAGHFCGVFKICCPSDTAFSFPGKKKGRWRLSPLWHRNHIVWQQSWTLVYIFFVSERRTGSDLLYIFVFFLFACQVLERQGPESRVQAKQVIANELVKISQRDHSSPKYSKHKKEAMRVSSHT